ncbi:hypothetical protein DL98DRAFT_535258 [Cadophora sp. DSE1049]|nr:hypothetical protein DL98DRAFT_535258 [Cadophora sp. DSE1049]
MDLNAIPPLQELDETFHPTPPGLSYDSTSQRLKAALENQPSLDHNVNEVKATLLPELTRFYTCQVREAHPEYNIPENQYYVDKACWEWCYPDPTAPHYQPVPGICPYARPDKYLAVLPYEAKLMPKFGDPPIPSEAPYNEGNPWIHFRPIVHAMEQMWYDQDCILRQMQGLELQDPERLCSGISRDKPDKWMSLRNAVRMLHVFVEYRGRQATLIGDANAVMPDLYDLLIEQVRILRDAFAGENARAQQ